MRGFKLLEVAKRPWNQKIVKRSRIISDFWFEQLVNTGISHWDTKCSERKLYSLKNVPVDIWSYRSRVQVTSLDWRGRLW